MNTSLIVGIALLLAGVGAALQNLSWLAFVFGLLGGWNTSSALWIKHLNRRNLHENRN